MPLHFAYLVLEEHPYGREMLRILLENNLFPSMIIQEVSAVGDEEREKFVTRMAGQPLPPRLAQIISGKKVPVYSVSNHNNDTCRDLLEVDKPDVLVLGGTRIIKPNILEIPRQSTVNAHPGLLPWLRGSASVGWALYKDMAQGATAHFVNPGIDLGDIIVSRELPVYRHDTYESINFRIATLAGELMAEAVTSLQNGNAPRTPQDPDVGETFKVIPEDLLEEGKQRLAQGQYSHFTD
jgi:methionyl-tRNA formyltransferase